MSSKYIKILAAVAILMELATFAVLAASVYTLSGSFMRTLIPQDEGAFKLEHGVEKSLPSL